MEGIEMGYQDRIQLHALKFVQAHAYGDHARYKAAHAALEKEAYDRRDEMNPIDVVDVIAGWLAPLWKGNPDWEKLLADNISVLEVTSQLEEPGHGRADYKSEDGPRDGDG